MQQSLPCFGADGDARQINQPDVPRFGGCGGNLVEKTP